MTIEIAKRDYPKFFEKVVQETFTDRELVVVDHNYDEVDAEEAGDFDPDVYNHFIYVTELSREAIGEDGIIALQEKLSSNENFDTFFASEDDLYGVQTDLDGSGISKIIFDSMEEIVS